MLGDKKKNTPVTKRCWCTHCLRPRTTTEETCRYWVGNIGKTVRITKGTFAGAWGRLNVVNVTQGGILLAQHAHPDIPTPIWVDFADLEVVVERCRGSCLESSPCKTPPFGGHITSPRGYPRALSSEEVHISFTNTLTPPVPPTATMKVILRQIAVDGYRVEGLVNVITPRIGQYLSATEVDGLCGGARFDLKYKPESVVEVEIR